MTEEESLLKELLGRDLTGTRWGENQFEKRYYRDSCTYVIKADHGEYVEIFNVTWNEMGNNRFHKRHFFESGITEITIKPAKQLRKHEFGQDRPIE